MFPILNEIILIITLSYIYLKIKTILKSTQKKENEELTHTLKTHLRGRVKNKVTTPDAPHIENKKFFYGHPFLEEYKSAPLKKYLESLKNTIKIKKLVI